MILYVNYMRHPLKGNLLRTHRHTQRQPTMTSMANQEPRKVQQPKERKETARFENIERITYSIYENEFCCYCCHFGNGIGSGQLILFIGVYGSQQRINKK